MGDPGNRADSLPPTQRALFAIQDLRRKLAALESAAREPIAIVGMACRFPGNASTPDAFWQLLRDGVDPVREVPPERWDVDAFYDPRPATPGKMNTRWGAFLQRVDGFDPELFGIAPREALAMDPQHRLLLEIAWEALEDAGLPPADLSGARAGVFAGLSTNDYSQLAAGAGDPTRVDAYLTMGNTPSAAAGRISYVLGLQGPSLVVDTACSSSLVGVHLACRSLRANECDVALAGGVNLILSPSSTIALSSLRMMSPDGRCKTFDAAADGFVRGEGCGMLVLRRLSDARAAGERILALVRGSSVNQDGRSGGFTMPSGAAQEALLRAALESAGVAPDAIDYVEAHGTGTVLGDPIELRALAAVLGSGRPADRPLLVGSVKTNLGHLEAAAGIAGLIKTVLALRHGEIPPHLHLSRPNPHVEWDELALRVPTQREPWSAAGRGRLAGVSSFGATGTNAHVILEEAPRAVVEPEVEVPDRPRHVLALSAREEAALDEVIARHGARLERTPAAAGARLADVCFTAGTGRSHFTHRAALVAASFEEARAQLASGQGLQRGVSSGAPRIAFLFTGQGAQHAGMARGLYEHVPAFRARLDRADALLGRTGGVTLLEALYGASGEELDHTRLAQPALYALEVSLAELWRSWGIEPSFVVGHSVGEYAAACVAGLFDFEQGLGLIAERARLFGGLPAGGAMLAVLAGEDRVRGWLAGDDDSLSLAAVNGPESVVVSGDTAAIARLEEELGRAGVRSERLRVSHAFHSARMEPALEGLREAAQGIRPGSLGVPLVSNVTGRVATDAELSDAGYWSRHARGTVRFLDCVETLEREGCDAYLEIGPHPVLLGLARGVVSSEVPCLPSLRRGRGDWEQLLESLASLYVAGAEVDWAAFDAGRERRKVALPTYPFQRRRFWLPEAVPPSPGGRARPRAGGHPLLGERLRAPGLKEVVYASEWDASSPAVLAEHRLAGEVVAPAAAYVEMALAAAREQLGGGPCLLEDLMLHEALRVAAGETASVRLTWEARSSGAGAFAIHASGSADEDWTLVASGSARSAHEAPAGEPPGPSDDESGASFDAEEHHAAIRARGVELGPGFRRVEELRRGPGVATARLRASRVEEDAGFTLHPGLLDACLQVLGAASVEAFADDDLVVPVAIERLFFEPGSAGGPWRSVARLREEQADETAAITGELALFDDAGAEVLRAEGVWLRRAPRELLVGPSGARRDELLHEVRWRRDEVVTEVDVAVGGAEPWLIFADRSGVALELAEALAARGQAAELLYGEGPERLLALAGRDWQGVVYLWGLDADGDVPGDVDATHARACGGLLSVVQTLSGSAPPRRGLWVVTRGAQPVGPPPAPVALEQAPLWGLAGTAALEHPELGCVRVDLDPSLGVDRAREVDALVGLLYRPPGEDRLALRGGEPFVARLERAGRAGLDTPFAVAPGGTVLVTGGLGALGLEVARWLVAHGARHLALAGRQAPSEAVRARLEELARGGAELRSFAADVTSRAEVDELLAEIAATMPPLRGVVHAAGVLDDGVLEQQTWERFAAVLAPKIAGAWHLHEATRGLSLELFVLFSSAASVLGSPGQASYAAANAFLDALASHRASLGLPALAVGWGPWAGGGMAGELDERDRRRMEAAGLRALAPASALVALERALSGTAPHVLALAGDWTRLARRLPEAGDLPLVRDLVARHRSAEPESAEPRGALRRELEAAIAPQRLPLLREHVRGLVGRVLGRDTDRRISDDDRFFELGMDSLMALELRNDLQSGLGCHLSSTLAFEHPTVAATARHLAEVLGIVLDDRAAAGAGEVPEEELDDALRAELDELTEEQVRARLEERLRAVEEGI